jgi:hypothetical protein
MIVVMGAGGTNRIDVLVDRDERSIADQSEYKTAGPAGGEGQFREQPEGGDPEEYSGTERDYNTRAPLHASQPKSQGGTGNSH